MSRKLFSMYCSANAIEGYRDERERALALLDKHLRGKAGVVVLGVGDPNWIYGQATFPIEDGEPLKFLDRFATVASNGLFNALLDKGKPDAILFTNEELKKRFEGHPAFRRARSLFRLVPDFRADPVAPKRGLLATVKGWFGKSATTTQDEHAAVVARLSDTFAERLRTEGDIAEATQLLLGLFQSGAIDKGISALEARVAGQPADAVGSTMLAIAHSELRDHDQAFKHAQVAIGLKDPPAEAWLWFAKEAWSVGSTTEGLAALDRIGEKTPERWPRSLRSGILMVRSALLFKSGAPNEACAALERACNLDGNNLATQVLLAAAYLQCNRIEAALNALDNAHVLDPGSVLVLAEICSLHARRLEDEKFSRFLSKLRVTEQGRFEAKRFPAKLGTATGEVDLSSIDADRRKMWVRKSFPGLFDLCDNTLIQTIGNLGSFLPPTDGSTSYYPRMSNGFLKLFREPLNSQLVAAIGVCLMLAGRKAAAVEWMEEAVAMAPENREYHLILVRAHREAGDDEKAFVACDRATALDMSDKSMMEQWVQLIWAGPRLKALESLAKVDALRDSFRGRALAMSKDNQRKADGLMALSVFLLPEDPEGALKAQREAIRLKPDSTRFHSFHCETLERLGRSDEAQVALRNHARTLIPNLKQDLAGIESLCKALLEAGGPFDSARLFAVVGMEISQDASSMRLLYARALIGLDRLDEAEEVLRTVAEADSETAADACGELGDALNNSGRHEEALSLFVRLQVLRPKDASGFLGAGISLWMLNREAEAASMLEEALKRDEVRPYAWGFYGRVLRFLQRNDEAERALRRAAAFPVPPTYSVSSLVRLLVEANRPADALTFATQVLSLDPAHAEAMAGRLEAEILIGERPTAERAALAWTRDFGHEAEDVIRICDSLSVADGRGSALPVVTLALRRFPNNINLLTEQARQLTGAGRFVEAGVTSQRALDLAPEDSDVLQVHAYVHSHLGSLDAHDAADLAGRLLKSSHTPDGLRTAADLLRAAGANPDPAYESALKAALDESSPQLHVAAWCLFHLRRFTEAIDHLDRHISENPDSHAAKLDREVFRFVGLDSEEARSELQVMIPKAAIEGDRIESVCELKYLVPQWKTQALGRRSVLEDLGRIVDSALAGRVT